MGDKQFIERFNGCHCANLRQVSRAVTQYYERLLKPSGLKVTQYTLLNHLNRVGTRTMTQISEGLNLDRTTLVRNFRILEEKGFIRMVSPEASRANLVQLTEKGQEVLEIAAPYWDRAQQSLEEFLPGNELEDFEKILQKLETAVQ